MMKKGLLILLFCLMNIIVFAQPGNDVEMADSMRSNGRIYVVVAVILTIFAGIIIYLIRLDKKITKLEKNNQL